MNESIFFEKCDLKYQRLYVMHVYLTLYKKIYVNVFGRCGTLNGQHLSPTFPECDYPIFFSFCKTNVLTCLLKKKHVQTCIFCRYLGFLKKMYFWSILIFLLKMNILDNHPIFNDILVTYITFYSKENYELNIKLDCVLEIIFYFK